MAEFAGIIIVAYLVNCICMFFIAKYACISALRNFEIREKSGYVRLRGFQDPKEEKQKCEICDVVISSNYDYGLVTSVDDDGYPNEVITCPTRGNGKVYYISPEKAAWYPTEKKMSEEKWMELDEGTYLDFRREAMTWLDSRKNS